MNICPRAPVEFSVAGWHPGLKIKDWQHLGPNNSILCVHYSGITNAYISPGRGKNDLTRLEFPREVINPNRPML